MRLLRRVVFAAILGGVAGAPLALAAEDEFQGLPKGPGQELTFYTCSACHSIRLVLQQRLTRVD